MKRKFIYVLVALSAFMFVGCSQENDLLVFSGLDIHSHVPKTRGASDDIFEGPDYNMFSYGENECCLIALVELKQQTMSGKTFTEEYPAEKYYYEYKKLAMSLLDEKGNQRYSGGAMDLELFLELGQHFGLLSERLDLSDEASKIEIFTNPTKNPSTILIDLKDEKTGQIMLHVARLINVDTNKMKVYYSIRVDGEISTGSISINDVKGAWR
jgi:hypothetical protein